jgi:hypothetical protein
VLLISGNEVVRATVRVLLGSIGYQCLVASSLTEVLRLQDQEKPDAVVLDPRADYAPAWVVATFCHRVPRLRSRTIVLIGERMDAELEQVLDAYGVARVRPESLLQELWPSLDSLLRSVASPEEVTRKARAVFDSSLQPSLSGARSLQPAARHLLYETDTISADVFLEAEKDSLHATLAGQVLDSAKPRPPLSGVPIVLQGQAGFVGIAKTNEFGEFRLELDVNPGLTVEMKPRTRYWVSFALPDIKTGPC